MNILQWGMFGALITALGCIASLSLWPYLNMVAEFFIEIGFEPMQAILATTALLTLVFITPLPFIWRRT
jgi:hypothetical protein